MLRIPCDFPGVCLYSWCSGLERHQVFCKKRYALPQRPHFEFTLHLPWAWWNYWQRWHWLTWPLTLRFDSIVMWCPLTVFTEVTSLTKDSLLSITNTIGISCLLQRADILWIKSAVKACSYKSATISSLLISTGMCLMTYWLFSLEMEGVERVYHLF